MTAKKSAKKIAKKSAAKKSVPKSVAKKAAPKVATKPPQAHPKSAAKPPKAAPATQAGRPANPLVPKRRDGDMAALPPLPRVPVGVLLGTHVSSQGGSFAAPPRATEIGATALQLFTKTPNQWKEREIDADEAAQFRAALDAAGAPVTVSHDSYLINLASPDDALRARSLDSFANELRRCHALGIHYLVSHPGDRKSVV